MGHKLTEKQAAFVREYLIDLNATQAAIRAGYSERSANNIGPENLLKPSIQEALAKGIEERAARTRLTQDEVIEGLRDAAELAREIKNPSAMVSAYSWLGRHKGMFIDRQEIAGRDGAPVTVEKIITVVHGH